SSPQTDFDRLREELAGSGDGAPAQSVNGFDEPNEDEDDWRYELLQENLRRLREATDAKGRTLEVHTIPMPAIMEITEDEAWGVDTAEGSIPRHAGDKTAASYLNFLIVNGGVILPAFDDPNDAVAKATLEGLFPGRKVVTVPGREIVLGGGNVHCITQQQPRG
ncbi:MAG: agmatine deiminase family protein, partial [Actinomycetes bacterium]